MSGSNWRPTTAFVTFGAIILGIAVWLSWDLSANQTEIRMRGEKSTQKHTEYAEERIERTCLDREGAALMECIHEEIKSAQDHSRAERDLDAQQAMALWAKLMALVSIAATGLTMFGLYFVWRTLKASESATKAALEAVEVTREIGEAQTGAYIDVRAASLEMHPSTNPPYRPGINFRIGNSGLSPAENVEMQVLWRVVSEGGGIFEGTSRHPRLRGLISVGGNGQEASIDTSFEGAEIPPKIVEKIRNEVVTWEIVATLNFCSIYKPERRVLVYVSNFVNQRDGGGMQIRIGRIQ